MYFTSYTSVQFDRTFPILFAELEADRVTTMHLLTLKMFQFAGERLGMSLTGGNLGIRNRK